MLRTFDLVRDYSRFVIEFFEVINISAPHIYHSALFLSPRMSIVRGLYKQCVRPFTRVVRGLPESWDPISATLYFDDFNGGAVWSPCGRFIAVTRGESTEILDAVTLNRINTLDSPPGLDGRCLSFTPDGHFLTRFFIGGTIVSWDVQTGGPLGTVQSRLIQFPQDPFSLTYSMDGKMIAAAYEPLPQSHDNGDVYLPRNRSYSVVIFDLFGTRIHTHHVPEGCDIPPIWTHGQCFRFATMKQSFITIWEVAFTSTHGPAEVESLPVPAEVAGWERLLFFPALSRLAFVLRGTVQIWDAKASKLLLKTETSPEFRPPLTPTHYPHWGSFSLDGHFFTCIISTGVYIWKESPSGYNLHQKLTFNLPPNSRAPRLSPDGESIVMSLISTIQLWHTRDQILPSSDTPAGDDYGLDFVLGFFPNELFAVFAQWGRNMVKVLDLQSGDLVLTIDVGIEISCLQMTENTVIAVGDGEVAVGDGEVAMKENRVQIVSWNLPGEYRTFKSGENIKDRAQTTTFHHPLLSYGYRSNEIDISVSPDLSRIAFPLFTSIATELTHYLGVYDVSTGRYLGSIKTTAPPIPAFTLDGRQIWDKRENLGWEIVEGSRSGTVELKPLEHTTRTLGLFPFHSSRGYEVTDDGWVLSPTRERLLWLPHRWRSTWMVRTWGGRFLALLHRELSDVVILEFFE